MLELISLLILFGLLHSLLADLQVKDWFKTKLGTAFRFYRIIYNLLFLLMLAGIAYILMVVQQPVYVFAPTHVIRITALALAITGVVLIIVSFTSFDLSEFIGFSYLRQTEQKQEKLRIDGLYKYVRHPLYFGTFVLITGLFLLHPTQMNLIALVFLYFYTYIGAILEEKKLKKIFGEDYVNYSRKVKMLIPFVF